MIIALATPRVATAVDECLDKIKQSLAEAAARRAAVVCFPEAYLPGLRGLDFEVPPFDRDQQERALKTVAQWARTYKIATILGMEWHSDLGRQIAAVVLDAGGQSKGVQTKNQLDPSEDPLYVPGHGRRLFEINGLKFGVAICHEAFRYPETVRWAAVRGASVVFHPHCTGSDLVDATRVGIEPDAQARERAGTQWGSPTRPYYEKAMMCRALENTIYFASVNYAFHYQESATSLISPTGECLAYLPYGQEGVLVCAIDESIATGLLASRYAPERYQELPRA